MKILKKESSYNRLLILNIGNPKRNRKEFNHQYDRPQFVFKIKEEINLLRCCIISLQT